MNALYASAVVLGISILILIIMKFFGNSAQTRKNNETVARDLIKRAGRYMETARSSNNQLLKNDLFELCSCLFQSCTRIVQTISYNHSVT